jgi:uncharacterized protein YxeA
MAIDPMKIAAGDPVTSDLIATIIKNINTLSTPAATTNINIENAGAKQPAATVSSTVLAKEGSKAVKSSDKGGSKATVKFGQTFNGTPHVWVQINTIGQSSPSWANCQVFPQIESITATDAVIRFRTNTANTTVKYTLFAAGEIASK